MRPLVPIEQVRVLYEGMFTDPQLNHPEGIAVDKSGNVWCGGEQGEIYRILPDGSKLELMASTGGFALGMAFDSEERLYVCDLKHNTIFRYDSRSQKLADFAVFPSGQRIVTPNFPVVDERRGVLYVSDSGKRLVPGPGIWKFDLETGEGALWYKGLLNFANGMVLSEDGGTLYVVETHGHKISRIAIDANGNPGPAEDFVAVDAYPDGLVLNRGYLYICCYSPGIVFRQKIGEDGNKSGELEVLVHDPSQEIIAHPTNGAIYGSTLYLPNLGRWHISAVALPE